MEKRFLATLLSSVMVITLFPIAAHALPVQNAQEAYDRFYTDTNLPKNALTISGETITVHTNVSLMGTVLNLTNTTEAFTLDLHGHTVSFWLTDLSISKGTVVITDSVGLGKIENNNVRTIVVDGGTLLLDNINIIAGRGTKAAVTVTKAGSTTGNLTMNGGWITGNGDAPAVNVEAGAFVMNYGVITGGYSISVSNVITCALGAVNLNGDNATFVMNGGIIQNTNTNGLRALFIGSGCTATMNNGTISVNSAEAIQTIGAVSIENGNFLMNNGVINENGKASHGIALDGGGATVSGGRIFSGPTKTGIEMVKGENNDTPESFLTLTGVSGRCAYISGIRRVYDDTEIRISPNTEVLYKGVSQTTMPGTDYYPGGITVTTTNPAVKITTDTSLPKGGVGIAYSKQLEANITSDDTHFWIRIEGLPPGIALTPTGKLTGTPTTAGQWIFYVSVINQSTGEMSAIKRFVLEIANTYSVTFNADGGTGGEVQTVIEGGMPVAPVVTQTGFNFVEWRPAIVAATADATYTAAWEAINYTITWVDGVSTTASSVAYDTLPTAPNVTKTGYTLDTWTPAIVAATTNATYTAQWTINSYDITFDANGGTVDTTNKVVTFNDPYGELPVPVLSAPIRVDYTFGGWFTDPDGTGVLVNAGTILTLATNHTLYAKWIPEAYVCDPSGDDPLTTTGSYTGYFFDDTAFANTTLPEILGIFSLKINTATGRLTAKAVTRKGSLSFTAKAWDAVEDADGTKHVTLTRRGGETLLLSVRQNRIWGSLSGGSLSGEILTLEGTRNLFADRKDTAAQAVLETYKGYYTLSLPPFESVPTGAAQTTPAGSGYLALTVGSSGKVKIAGLLADGTRVSQSSTLILFDGCGPEACVPLFVPLYSRKGSMGALLWFTPGGKGTVTTDRDLGWFVRWEKPAKKADGGSVLLDAFGGYYSTATALEDHYRFYADANAVPYHYTGGIADLQAAALPDGIGVAFNGTRLAITRGTRPPLVSGAYDYSAENSAMATFSLTSRTGIFKGLFKLYYDYARNGRLSHKTAYVSYAGILTPMRSDVFAGQPAGQGYYLVPDNDPALKAYRLKRSFPIWLDAAP
ncbi:MAG: InlB B-repeat-containing protein [Kiritimatiellae bacterium]|nr:InlB B-repeat-containing protein [Kiritimatiellia bacterium]